MKISTIKMTIRVKGRSVDKNNVTINFIGLTVYISTSNPLFSLKH